MTITMAENDIHQAIQQPLHSEGLGEAFLQQIEQYASIYMKISDIAFLLDIPVEQLRAEIADRTTAVSRAYNKGKAASKLKLLHQEMQLAYVGSPLALENTHKNLLDMEDDE